MRRVLPLIALSVLSASACDFSTTGENGVLEFNYASTALGVLAGLSTPVAVGATASINVNEIGNDNDPSIDSASSSNDDTVSVAGTAAQQISILANGVGTAKLDVAATSQTGAELQDRVEVNAVVPFGIELVPTCNGNESDAPVLTDRVAYVRYRLVTEDDSNVIGDNYYPVQAVEEGTASVNLAESRSGLFGTPYMAIDIGSQAGDVVMQSDLERDDEITFDAVTPSEVDGVALNDVAATLEMGKKVSQQLRPTVGNAAICPTALPYDVQTLTPETCTVSKTSVLPLTPGYLLAGSELGLQIEGLAVGPCTYQVTLPSLGDGGVSATFDLDIEAAE